MAISSPKRPPPPSPASPKNKHAKPDDGFDFDPEAVDEDWLFDPVPPPSIPDESVEGEDEEEEDDVGGEDSDLGDFDFDLEDVDEAWLLKPAPPPSKAALQVPEEDDDSEDDEEEDDGEEDRWIPTTPHGKRVVGLTLAPQPKKRLAGGRQLGGPRCRRERRRPALPWDTSAFHAKVVASVREDGQRVADALRQWLDDERADATDVGRYVDALARRIALERERGEPLGDGTTYLSWLDAEPDAVATAVVVGLATHAAFRLRDAATTKDVHSAVDAVLRTFDHQQAYDATNERGGKTYPDVVRTLRWGVQLLLRLHGTRAVHLTALRHDYDADDNALTNVDDAHVDDALPTDLPDRWSPEIFRWTTNFVALLVHNGRLLLTDETPAEHAAAVTRSWLASRACTACQRNDACWLCERRPQLGVEIPVDDGKARRSLHDVAVARRHGDDLRDRGRNPTEVFGTGSVGSDGTVHAALKERLFSRVSGFRCSVAGGDPALHACHRCRQSLDKHKPFPLHEAWNVAVPRVAALWKDAGLPTTDGGRAFRTTLDVERRYRWAGVEASHDGNAWAIGTERYKEVRAYVFFRVGETGTIQTTRLGVVGSLVGKQLNRVWPCRHLDWVPKTRARFPTNFHDPDMAWLSVTPCTPTATSTS